MLVLAKYLCCSLGLPVVPYIKIINVRWGKGLLPPCTYLINSCGWTIMFMWACVFRLNDRAWITVFIFFFAKNYRLPKLKMSRPNKIYIVIVQSAYSWKSNILNKCYRPCSTEFNISFSIKRKNIIPTDSADTNISHWYLYFKMGMMNETHLWM